MGTRAEQIDPHYTKAPYKRWVKRVLRRLMRRLAKKDPDQALPRKPFRGYTT